MLDTTDVLTHFIPRHCLVPLVKETMYRLRYSPFLAALTHRSGSNFAGSGKSVGSMCTK